MSEGFWKNAYKEIRKFTLDMKKENLSAFASSAAFFIFLSLVPILIVICTLIPYTPLTKENLLGLLLEVTPERVESIITVILDDVYQSSAGVLSAAVLVTLWSAGKGVLAMIRGLNAVNDVEEQRNYFSIRLVSSFYTLVILLIIMISLILLLFGNTLVEVLLYHLPELKVLFGVLVNFRFIVIWLLLTIIFGAFYAYLPNIKLKFRNQLPGAAFAAAIWSIFSWCFSMYVDYGMSFHIYGRLTIIVIFMMWLYICFYIIFIGAYINKYREIR